MNVPNIPLKELEKEQQDKHRRKRRKIIKIKTDRKRKEVYPGEDQQSPNWVTGKPLTQGTTAMLVREMSALLWVDWAQETTRTREKWRGRRLQKKVAPRAQRSFAAEGRDQDPAPQVVEAVEGPQQGGGQGSHWALADPLQTRSRGPDAWAVGKGTEKPQGGQVQFSRNQPLSCGKLPAQLPAAHSHLGTGSLPFQGEAPNTMGGL